MPVDVFRSSAGQEHPACAGRPDEQILQILYIDLVLIYFVLSVHSVCALCCGCCFFVCLVYNKRTHKRLCANWVTQKRISRTPALPSPPSGRKSRRRRSSPVFIQRTDRQAESVISPYSSKLIQSTPHHGLDPI